MSDMKSLEAAYDRGLQPASRDVYYIDLPDVPSGAHAALPVAVLNGAESGPTMWISSAIHGDEINGVDICRRLLRELDVVKLRGTVLVLPIVDVYGFDHGSRYMPDRRDLNRSFPGSANGSLTSRVAHRFVTQIVDRSDAGIDLHSGAQGRTNAPQVRGVIGDPSVAELAAAFNAPITIDSKIIDGSLREVASERSIPYVLFEGGAASHFDPVARDVAVDGCLRVMQRLGLIDDAPPIETPSVIVHKTSWIRAPRSGVLDLFVTLGERVAEGARIAAITDTFGDEGLDLHATADGIVVGMATDPLVQAGEAVVNLGRLN